MSMSLEAWDKNVKPHLNFIRSGAEMAARHARALPVRAVFATAAETDLADAKSTLEAALAEINAAQEAYNNKPVEQSNAA